MKTRTVRPATPENTDDKPVVDIIVSYPEALHSAALVRDIADHMRLVGRFFGGGGMAGERRNIIYTLTTLDKRTLDVLELALKRLDSSITVMYQVYEGEWERQPKSKFTD